MQALQRPLRSSPRRRDQQPPPRGRRPGRRRARRGPAAPRRPDRARPPRSTSTASPAAPRRAACAAECEPGVEVARLVDERCAQRLLVARTRRRDRPRSGIRRVEEPFDLRARGRTPVNSSTTRAVAERLDVRDAADAEAPSQARVRVGVDLDEAHRALAGLDGRLEHGRQLSARAAPLGPEVDERPAPRTRRRGPSAGSRLRWRRDEHRSHFTARIAATIGSGRDVDNACSVSERCSKCESAM